MTKPVEEAKGQNTKTLWQALNITTGTKPLLVICWMSILQSCYQIVQKSFADEVLDSQYSHPSVSRFLQISAES